MKKTLSRVSIAGGAAFLIALAGCTVTVGPTVNMEKAEAEIAKGIEEQTGTAVKVTCPSTVTAQAGDTFTCEATTANGDSAKVLVTQQDNEGNVTWELPDTSQIGGGGTLIMENVKTSVLDGISQQMNIPRSDLTVTCPASVKIDAGSTFTCEVIQTNGDTGTVLVTQKDNNGNVSWKLL